MKQKDVLIIFILLFIFVAIWIGSNLYHATVSSTISETINQDILPIAPTFDSTTIDKLKQRQKINPSFELVSITPTPTTSPIQIVAPQNASQGGKITP